MKQTALKREFLKLLYMQKNKNKTNKQTKKTKNKKNKTLILTYAQFHLVLPCHLTIFQCQSFVEDMIVKLI